MVHKFRNIFADAKNIDDDSFNILSDQETGTQKPITNIVEALIT